jgi:two-component system chemotaxis response regulator CheY
VKIVIADDEQQHAFLLELFLRKWGYTEIYSLANGGEALAVIEKELVPCLAILDWEMPVMDGLEVTRRLKNGERRDIYVLLVTAKTQSADRAKAMAAGVDAFMAKPYQPEELRKALLAGEHALEQADLK